MCAAVHLRHQKTTTASGTFLGFALFYVFMYLRVYVFIFYIRVFI